MCETYNIYCDETCHLENDGKKVMVMGAVWCPLDKTTEINERIKEIKLRHALPSDFEIKWVKVSASKKQFYLDILDYFFDDNNLHFRGILVPDKSILAHKKYQQTHDDWYYKMYYQLLTFLLEPHSRYRIYLDIKDTKGSKKVKKLGNVLCNKMYDFSMEIIERIQLVRSHEISIIQICDLMIGAIAYYNRGLKENQGKLELIERIKKRSGYDLKRNTLFLEKKVNILRWIPNKETS